MIQPPIEEERAVIGACLLSDIAIEDTAAILAPGDFTDHRHQSLYQAIIELHDAGQRVDVLTLAKQLPAELGIGLEQLHALQNDTPSISNAAKYATAIADYAVRRRLALAAADIAALANGDHASHDAADAADRARELLANIDMPIGKGAPDPDIDSFIGSVDTSYDWLIPGFLERRDRMLVTAGEGMGKSVLLAQIAVMAAAGIHPWTIEQVPPRNVLLVDLENGSRLVTRRLDGLRRAAGAQLNPQRLRIHSRPGGIDLTSRTDRRWLLERCQANNAELLVIGPAYRMSDGAPQRGDTGGEAQARAITKALDDIRNRAGVALLMETHAPHGNLSGRDLRPIGSSVWLRWPEFGVGFAIDDDHGRRAFKLSHWRGPRDHRTWPTHIERYGKPWPWLPLMPTGTYSSAA